jgi:hypothetical protein
MRLLLMALIGVLLTACAHAPRSGEAAKPRALAPVAAVSPRSASQVIHAAYGDRAVTLRTALQVDAASLTLVGVTATGQRVFTASWDGKTITAERGVFVPSHVEPERVLADMQLALWPLQAVQEALGNSYEVSEPFAGVRRLKHSGRLIAEVHYAGDDPWSGRLWFVSFEHDYSLTVDTTTASN